MKKREQQPLWIQDWVKEDFSQAIEKAIEQAEKKCALDFFPVVVKSSTTQGHVFPLLVLVLLSLYMGVMNFVSLPNFGLWFMAVHALIAVIVIVLAYSLSENLWLARWLTAKKDQDYSVEHAARLAYFEHGIDQHPSVLIFVSLMERKIILLCRDEVDRQIAPKVFQRAIDTCLQYLKRSDLQTALELCLQDLSEQLKDSFPITSTAKNHMPNKAVIKD